MVIHICVLVLKSNPNCISFCLTEPTKTVLNFYIIFTFINSVTINEINTLRILNVHLLLKPLFIVELTRKLKKVKYK